VYPDAPDTVAAGLSAGTKFAGGILDHVPVFPAEKLPPKAWLKPQT